MQDVTPIFQNFDLNGCLRDVIQELQKDLGEERLNALLAVDGVDPARMDSVRFSEKFFQNGKAISHVSVDPNANVSSRNIEHYGVELIKPHSTLFAYDVLAKKLEKNYGKDIAKRILRKVLTGEIFINDISKFEKPYCYAFTLDRLLQEGIPFVTTSFKIVPPKHSDSFIALVVQMISYTSNHIAGACSFPSFFVDLDWFLRQEFGDDYTVKWEENKKRVTNKFQNFIYSCCWPFRSAQSSFTNVSIFDKVFLKKLFGSYKYPGGNKVNIESVYEVQKRFAEYFSEIFGKEGIFSFPVITLALSVDENRKVGDPDFLDWVSKVNSEKALFNIYAGEVTSLAMCCRLKNHLRAGEQSLGYTNSIGSSSLNIGSHRVAGLNLPRIALRSCKEGKGVYELITETTQDAQKVLKCHRDLLKKEKDLGLLPLYDNGWMSLSRQYSTIGFLGAYEFLEILGKDMRKEEDRRYLVEILKCVSNLNKEEEKATGNAFNLEQIPAESMAVRLAKKDRIFYDWQGYPIYSNQYFPLSVKIPLIERIVAQGSFDQETSGGSILHINEFSAESFSPELMKRLVLTAVDKGCTYFAVNKNFCKCSNGHILAGNSTSQTCSVCGQPIIEKYTRVVGFITPVSSWIPERVEYDYEKRVSYSGLETQ